MPLPKDLIDAIESALPTIQAKDLQSKLNELEEKAERVKYLEGLLEAERRDSSRVAIERNDARSEVARLKDVLGEAIGERDSYKQQVRDTDVAQLRAELDATNRTTDKFLTHFLKNTTYRENWQHQVVNETPNMVYQPQGNGYSVNTQEGVNKVHVPVVDTKEQTTE